MAGYSAPPAVGMWSWRWRWRLDRKISSARRSTVSFGRSSQTSLFAAIQSSSRRATRLPLRSAGRTASPVSAVPIPISAYRPCHGMAFSASLDLASLQSEDINSMHICCAPFGSSNLPITPVLRAAPRRELQICRQRRNDVVSPPVIQSRSN